MGESVSVSPALSFIHNHMFTLHRNWIEDTLSKGYTIICDRYYYSGIAYSAAKNNPSLSLNWATQPEIGLPKPDGIVFLDLEPWQAEQRGGYGEEKYEKKEFQQRVRESYLRLMGNLSETASGKTAKVINAGGSMDDVEERIWKKVLPWVEKAESGSYGEKASKFEG